MEPKLYVPQFSALHPNARQCEWCQAEVLWLATPPPEYQFLAREIVQVYICQDCKLNLRFRVTAVPNETLYHVEVPDWFVGMGLSGSKN